jgi:hypothetical protein
MVHIPTVWTVWLRGGCLGVVAPPQRLAARVQRSVHCCPGGILTACASLVAGHEMVTAAAQGDPHQQQLAGAEPPDLNPDGSEKKKRRQHTRWKEEEVMRLLEGVECLGVGHWRQMCVPSSARSGTRALSPGGTRYVLPPGHCS